MAPSDAHAPRRLPFYGCAHHARRRRYASAFPATDNGVLVGLLGHQIAYSASPRMQNAAFKAMGLGDWSYELFDVPPDELAAAVAALRLPGRAGWDG